MIFISRDNLTIRSSKVEDSVFLLKWWNNGEIMALEGYPKGLGITKDEIVEMIEANNKYSSMLIIEYNNNPIGEMSYKKIDDERVGVGIRIFERYLINRGLGTRSLKMLINYLYNGLKFKTVVVTTNLENRKVHGFYEKNGFKKIKTKFNSWRNQLGKKQSSVIYELTLDSKSRVCINV